MRSTFGRSRVTHFIAGLPCVCSWCSPMCDWAGRLSPSRRFSAPPAGSLFEEHCERALAFVEQLHQTRVRAVAEVVACLHLLGPAFELAEICLELLQLPEREVAVFGLAGHVLEQLHGLADDVGVFLR